MGGDRRGPDAHRVAAVGAHGARTMSRVLGPGGNSRDFAYVDELGMLEFGAAWCDA